MKANRKKSRRKRHRLPAESVPVSKRSRPPFLLPMLGVSLASTGLCDPVNAASRVCQACGQIIPLGSARVRVGVCEQEWSGYLCAGCASAAFECLQVVGELIAERDGTTLTTPQCGVVTSGGKQELRREADLSFVPRWRLQVQCDCGWQDEPARLIICLGRADEEADASSGTGGQDS